MVWALKDVCFEVKQGEALGIIGRNGAGKSTLLKILSRVAGPTSGAVRVKGRIASLLEVGTGFHPELTGRENIFLNGAILGMTKAEIRAKLEEIVEFSGVERFVDTPVKRYSSGMTVRLAFAVAAHLEPEILIVDEVLAVGDAEFQKKCLGKMRDVASAGRTVLFVSHNMSAIRVLCDRGLVLKSGRVEHMGSADESVMFYEEKSGATETATWLRPAALPRKPLSFEQVEYRLKGEQPRLRLVLHILFASNAPHRASFVAVDIAQSGGMPLMQALPTLKPVIQSGHKKTRIRISVTLPPLVPGVYSVSLWVGPHNTETIDYVPDVVSFGIEKSPTPGRTYPHNPHSGIIVPESEIEVLGHGASSDAQPIMENA
jgi:lipopolysaccharide transport system ATP-binding protein